MRIDRHEDISMAEYHDRRGDGHERRELLRPDRIDRR
jgi:hypothetical protein